MCRTAKPTWEWEASRLKVPAWLLAGLAVAEVVGTGWAAWDMFILLLKTGDCVDKEEYGLLLCLELGVAY
jgi:hypothetical protein